MSALTRDELIDELLRLRFRMGETASKKWRAALALRNGQYTMVVLVRAMGVDLLITPLDIGEMLNPSGKLSVSAHRDGDRFVECSYLGNEAAVNSRILSAANIFACGEFVDDVYFKKIGIGRKEWFGKYGAEAKATEFYRSLDNGDGAPIYLSDGVWLQPDGSLEEGK